MDGSGLATATRMRGKILIGLHKSQEWPWKKVGGFKLNPPVASPLDIPQIYLSWLTFAEGCTVFHLFASESHHISSAGARELEAPPGLGLGPLPRKFLNFFT